MKISKDTPLDKLIPYFAELALSRGLDEQPPTDRQELVARIKELEALPVKNTEDEGSDSGTEDASIGDGSASANESAATGDGSASDNESAATGDSAASDNEGAATGDGSASANESVATGDSAASDNEGAATDSDVKLVNIKPLCSIRCSHGQQRYNIDGSSKSVAVPESLANDLVNGKYAVLI